jgi:hypothetical protein
MTSSSTRIALRGLAGLALGVALATSGGAGTVLGARPTPAITDATCTVQLYEGSSDLPYTRVAWEGLRPSRVVFWWTDPYGSWTTVLDHPKGSQAAVLTPDDAYLPEAMQGTVTVYGPHGIQLERSYLCDQRYY